MKWFHSVAEATSSTLANQLPIMVNIARIGNVDDMKMQDRMASWNPLAQMSRTVLAAVKMKSDSQEAITIVKIIGPKAVPGLVWLDHYGNPVMAQSVPDTSQPIAGTVANWKSTLANIEKYFASHQARGDAFLKIGKLREAYLEYSPLAKFKGPNAEKAQAAAAKVKEAWMKVAAVAVNLPDSSRDRIAILKGLRAEVKDTDYASGFEKDVLAAMTIADANRAAAYADGGNGTPAIVPPPVPTTAPIDPNAADAKPLGEVSAASSSSVKDSSDVNVDVGYLLNNSNQRLKEAGKLIEGGIAAFKKATAESMDRGDPRNELLKTSHDNFDKSLTIMTEMITAKPDETLRRLSERVSMLLYASLKYQSL